MHYHAMIEEPISGLFTTDHNSGKLHVFNFREFLYQMLIVMQYQRDLCLHL